jgi:hypothetical protein
MRTRQIRLTQDNLREIFSLLVSCTEYEKNQIYDQQSDHYFKYLNLDEEYEPVTSKEEFARDAWRAVLYFLYQHGYTLVNSQGQVDLKTILEKEFVDEPFVETVIDMSEPVFA